MQAPQEHMRFHPKTHPLLKLLKEERRIFKVLPKFDTENEITALTQISAIEKSYYLKRFQDNQKKLQNWARQFPHNQWPLPITKRRELKNLIQKISQEATPLSLEMACGTGWFSSLYQLKASRGFSIGVDRSGERISKAQRLALALGVQSHCLFVHSHTLPFLQFLVPERCFDLITVFYPNIHVKTTQSERRFPLSLEFVRCLELLTPQGQLIITSNVFSFIKSSAIMGELAGFTLTLSSFDQKDFKPYLPRTAFEWKFLERGERLFQLSLKRVSET